MKIASLIKFPYFARDLPYIFPGTNGEGDVRGQFLEITQKNKDDKYKTNIHPRKEIEIEIIFQKKIKKKKI